MIERFTSEGAPAGGFGVFAEPYLIGALARAPDGTVYVAVSQGTATDVFPFVGVGTQRPFLSLPGEIVDLDVAADGCTLYYALRTGRIKRVNGCATGPEDAEFATNARGTGLRLLPDGTLLVAGLDHVIRRLLPDGRTGRGYPAPAGSGGWSGAIDLTPDGRGFWAGTRFGRVYQVDLASGTTVRGPISGSSGAVRDLAVVGAPRGVAPRVAETPGPESLDVDGVFPLTDEAVSTVRNPAPEPSNACASDVPGTLEYSSSGRAVGPYAGSFEASGRVSYGPQNLSSPRLGPLALAPGRVTAAEGRFSIRAARGVVTGTLSLPAGRDRNENAAACARFSGRSFPQGLFGPGPLSGYFWAVSARRLRYEAAIEVNGRTYVDRGASYVYSDEYNVTYADGVLAGAARRYTQSWVSEAFSLTDSFTAPKQVEAHTAGLTRATKAVELTIRWSDPKDSFDVTGIRLVTGQRSLQSVGKLKPRGVQVEVVQRTRRMLKVRITKLKPRRLAFEVRAIRASGATPVTTEIRRLG